MEMFETLRVFLMENLPDVIAYVLLGISYFLFILFNNSVNSSKKSMTLMFRDHTERVNHRAKETEAQYIRLKREHDELRRDYEILREAFEISCKKEAHENVCDEQTDVNE